jgi:hypothetical protein
MPDIRIYLPDEMYMRFKKEGGNSKLIQTLLKEYWEIKEKGKKKK